MLDVKRLCAGLYLPRTILMLIWQSKQLTPASSVCVAAHSCFSCSVDASLYGCINLLLYAPKCFPYLSYMLPADDPALRVRRFKPLNMCYTSLPVLGRRCCVGSALSLASLSLPYPALSPVPSCWPHVPPSVCPDTLGGPGNREHPFRDPPRMCVLRGNFEDVSFVFSHKSDTCRRKVHLPDSLPERTKPQSPCSLPPSCCMQNKEVLP